MVGANTIRRDDPRLLIRSVKRQDERVRRGLTPHPVRVTLTGGGGVDATARFFSTGDIEKIIYTPDPEVTAVRGALGEVATYEIHLVIAPFFVGDRHAPRFAHPGRFPQNSAHPMTLAETRQMGDVALLRYLR